MRTRAGVYTFCSVRCWALIGTVLLLAGIPLYSNTNLYTFDLHIRWRVALGHLHKRAELQKLQPLVLRNQTIPLNKLRLAKATQTHPL